jgi:hypothetical protein
LIGQIWRIKLLYSPTGEYNKTEITVEVTDKEISEIKTNSGPVQSKWLGWKNNKTGLLTTDTG